MGVFAAERLQPRRTGGVFSFTQWGMNGWFILTFLMGAFFVAGQTTEYSMLVSEHVTLSSNAYGSAFYITTGFHGLHVIGGLIAFLLIMGRSFAAKKFGHFRGNLGHRHLVLLALRGRRLDWPLPGHLRPQVVQP